MYRNLRDTVDMPTFLANRVVFFLQNLGLQVHCKPRYVIQPFVGASGEKARLGRSFPDMLVLIKDMKRTLKHIESSLLRQVLFVFLGS